MKNNYIKTLCLLAIISFTACYEPTEGCLEINASNFDVEADNPCDNCCNLPDLSIGILNRLSDADSSRAFRLTTPYQNPTDTHQVFQINKLFFYLSDIQLITSDGDVKTSRDSSEIAVLESPGDTQKVFIKNDIGFFQKNISESQNLGSFLPGGNYQKASFTFGLRGENLKALPHQTASAHPLGFKSDSMNWKENTGYIFCRIDLVKDTSNLDDVLVIEITDSDFKNVELSRDFELKTGFNTKINFRVNYLDWLTGVDLKNDSDQTVKNKIIQNIPGAFSIADPEQ